MTVDVFDIETFQKALPEGSQNLGIEMGEYIFSVKLDDQVSVHIRSSIKSDGLSASTGDDSIRFSLWNDSANDFLGKISTYTTRVPGWQNRLNIQIEALRNYRNKAGDCPECWNPKHIFLVSKDGPNHGRVFAKCSVCDTGFSWLDIPTNPVFKPVDLQIQKGFQDISDILMSDDNEEQIDQQYENYIEERLSVESVKPIAHSLREPNDEQKAVINAPMKPLRVEAGPGSGKTFTIARRYKYLVDSGISPDKILAVTFNVKMAKELGVKISEMVPSIIGTRAERQICSIHAFCFRFLKEFFTEWQGKTLAPEWWIKRFITEKIEKMYKKDDRPAYEEVRAVIDEAKNKGYDGEHASMFYSMILPEFYASGCQEIHDALDAEMQKMKYFTFADQLNGMELALDRVPMFLRYVQDQIEAIIVDEAQDTNGQSMRILNKIASKKKNILIVGDRDQLLYRFTGATPEMNLGEGFEENYPEGESFPLLVNYRSDSTIIENAVRSISHNYDVTGGVYDSRFLKQCRPRPNAPAGVPIQFDEYLDPNHEAFAIRDTIREMLIDGCTPDQFFVGFRTRAQAGFLEYVLATSDIPFINTTGSSFWSLKHVVDVIAYFKVAFDKDDSESFKMIYNIPSKYFTVPYKGMDDYGKYVNHRFLGKQFIEECPSASKLAKVGSSVFKWRSACADIVEMLYGIANETRAGRLGDGIRFIITACYENYMNYESGNAGNVIGEGHRIDDLYTVAEIADNFSKPDDFLKYVNGVLESAKSKDDGDWEGKVVLSTIHRLKGLERDFVFGAGISEYDPSVPKNPICGLLPHTFSMTKPPNLGKFDIWGMGRMEDERCLFFVLITRARKRVFLSSIKSYRKVVMRPSRFLYEIGLAE